MTDMNRIFFKTLFASMAGLIILYVLFISYVNPQMTAPFSLTNEFTPYHDNFLLRKTQVMEGQNYETLILGSSTSEAFSVQDVNHSLKTSSFHGSIGGGNTASRYVLFKKAQKNFKDLKRVVYIADLYEFNQPKPVDILAFNDQLSLELAGKDLLPWKGDYLKYLFSHKTFESAFTVMKRAKKDYQSPLLKDGSTTTSMIMSTVHTEENFNSKVSPDNKPKLMEEVLENYGTYSRSVLANFKELSPDVKKLFLALVQEAGEKNIEVIFILSPYHFEFRKLLFQNEDVKNRYQDWVAFFNELGKSPNVKLYNPLESVVATDPDSGVWRDGIHFNSQTAVYFLNAIAKGERQ